MKPLSITASFEDMPLDPEARREVFVEFFGQHVFSTRNQRLAAIRGLVDSAESRNRLGTIHRRPDSRVGQALKLGEEGAN